jgi:hypothetical protein
MSKIVKNTTGSDYDVNDVGVTITASGQYTIQPQDYLLWAASDDIITGIGSGDLVVNDGSSDLSISDGTDLIKGIFPSSISINNTSSSPAVSTLPIQNQSSFGDMLSESFEPISQISAVYGLNGDSETFEATGGTADTNNNMFRCQTGTSIGGYAVIRTARPTVYREGLGMTTRLTSKFSTGVANSVQFGGYFNLTENVAFGYRGADFGILIDTYGSPEVRDLTITSSGNGTLTLTLDGTAYNIPITTGTIQHNAYEIEAWMNNPANQTIWNVQQDNDRVVFLARDTASRTGTYSISGAGLAGTFSQIEAGAAKTEKTILKANWNKDTASWLDPTDPNVYMIKLSYLGFGPFRFFIINPTTSEFVLVHEEINAGSGKTKPSIGKRALKVGWVAASAGSTTNLTVEGGSASSFIDGESKLLKPAKATSGQNTSVGNSFESVVAIRAKEEYSKKVMLGRIAPLSLSIANDSTKTVEYRLIKNPDYGETNFLSVSSDSIAQSDTSNNALIDLTVLDVELLLNDTLVVFARKTGGTDPTVDAALIWKEDY